MGKGVEGSDCNVLTYYPTTCPERLMKIMKNFSQDCQPLGTEIIMGHSKYATS
jgi:hydrogenase maturation factor